MTARTGSSPITNLNIEEQDSITLTGISKTQLEAPLQDFKFHA